MKIVGMARPQPVDLWRIRDAADEAQLRRAEDSADVLTPARRRARAGARRRRPAARGAGRWHAPVAGRSRATRELLDRTRRCAQARKDLARLTDDARPARLLGAGRLAPHRRSSPPARSPTWSPRS